MNIDVIIVNYRSGDDLRRCLPALREQTVPHSVQIIDNASEDGSVRALHAEFPEAAILPLRYNVGFGRAVNIGARRSKQEIIVTLNPDTLPAPDFIERITAPLRDDPTLGSVAGTLLFESQPDTIASAGITVHRNGVAMDFRLGERHERESPVTPVFGPSGGAAAYRRSAFLEAGGMAEPFFMYMEDVDLAWRLQLLGYQSVWAPAASVLHRYSASAGEGSEFKRRLLARNRIWTLVRCLPDELWRRDWMAIAGFDAAALGYSMATLDMPALTGRLSGMAGVLPRLSERRAIQRGRRASIESIDRWVEPPISARRMLALRRLTARLAS